MPKSKKPSATRRKPMKRAAVGDTAPAATHGRIVSQQAESRRNAPASPMSPEGNANRPFRMDTHHHFFPPQLINRMLKHTPTLQSIKWSASGSLEAMDAQGIATAILSAPTSFVTEATDREEARQSIRECNEFGAKLVRDYPGRFGLFASAPWFDPEGALREITYALDVLKANGVCFTTSYADRWPGDPAFAEVFDELNRRKAIVFFHPIAPRCCARLPVGIQPGALEFVFDTTRAIMSLMLNGTLSRCRDLRFIFAHGGGTLPALRERVDYVITEDPALAAKFPTGITELLRRLYFDVVLVTNPANFALLTQVMPSDHLLMGTDFPFVPPSHTVTGLRSIGLDPDVLAHIESGNAQKLFPSFAP